MEETLGLWELNVMWDLELHAAAEKAIGRKASEVQTNILA